MKFGIDIGHNVPYDGGAVSYLNENTCAMEVGKLVIAKLRGLGHTVIECKPQSATSLSNSLNARVTTANNNNVDLFCSIHFNAFKDGVGTGCEVWAWDKTTDPISTAILNNLVNALGIPNRGIKYTTSLYVLKNTTMPAILVECLFVDNKADAEKYNAEKIAQAIAYGLLKMAPPVANSPAETGKIIRLQVGAYKNEDNANKELERLKALGINAIKVYSE